MHLAYAWIVVHLALRSAAQLGWVLPSLATHALTVGAIGGLTIGMMTRVALGHTGRPLMVARAIAVAYLLLTFTALLRTFGVAIFPAHYLMTLTIAAITWSACFGIFLVVYAPILWRPRVDGKSG